MDRNYLKLLWLIGYIAFAGISCYTTAESLHMLIPSWSKIMIWVLTIGFFIMASLGTKMIVDSLNQNKYVENRTLRLVGGIFLVLVFWLSFSFPTNTHTFFYRAAIDDKVITDIVTTRGYLTQIEDNSGNQAQAKLKVEELESRVTALVDELTAEIMNEANPGLGNHSKKILGQLATTLGVSKIESLSYIGTSEQDRQKLCEAYRKKIFMMMQTKTEQIMKNIIQPSAKNVREAKIMNDNLGKMLNYIKSKTIDLNDSEDVTGDNGVCSKLNEAYNIIRKNKDFINFSSKEEEKIYTEPNSVTNVKRMVSVYDVWIDFFNGKLGGRGFILWILASLLVDLAAFIFFDML